MQAVFKNIQGSAEIQLDVLKAICGDTKGKSMMDIGCGFAPTTRQLGFNDRVFVDIVERDMGDESGNFVKADVLMFTGGSRWLEKDVIISLDHIEHFWEEDGRKIIGWMEQSARKPIIFTPQGRYMNVSDETDSHPDTHKYSWEDWQFQEMGWATITFPHFHPTLGEGGLGAFFAFKCENLEAEFQRIITELNTKSWTK